jgi:hypothetical protein
MSASARRDQRADRIGSIIGRRRRKDEAHTVSTHTHDPQQWTPALPLPTVTAEKRDREIARPTANRTAGRQSQGGKIASPASTLHATANDSVFRPNPIFCLLPDRPTVRAIRQPCTSAHGASTTSFGVVVCCPFADIAHRRGVWRDQKKVAKGIVIRWGGRSVKWDKIQVGVVVDR